MPATAGLEGESATAGRVGWGFIALYTLAFISTSLLFLAPLLVTLALKVNSLVGSNRRRAAWHWSPGPAPCWRWSGSLTLHAPKPKTRLPSATAPVFRCV